MLGIVLFQDISQLSSIGLQSFMSLTGDIRGHTVYDESKESLTWEILNVKVNFT